MREVTLAVRVTTEEIDLLFQLVCDKISTGIELTDLEKLKYETLIAKLTLAKSKV